MKKLFVFLIIILTIINTAYATEFDEEFAIAQKIVGKDGLNIVDISEDDVITRADMVDIIIKLTQIQNDDIFTIKYSSAPSGEIVYYKPFSDWNLDEKTEQLIERLYVSEIIKGCGDNMFNPNRVCTFEEAITFIVRGLGWGVLTETVQYYGYPNGYIQIANELGLIGDDFNINNKNFNKELVKVIQRSLLSDTLERLNDAFYQEIFYESTSCPLEKYLGLNYTYGYATKEEAGLTIDDDFFVGEVFENEEFKQGYVMCIYDTDEESNEKRIVICLEISKDYYDSKTSD